MTGTREAFVLMIFILTGIRLSRRERQTAPACPALTVQTSTGTRHTAALFLLIFVSPASGSRIRLDESTNAV